MSRKQSLHFTHALGNAVILAAILIVAAGTFYLASGGKGFGQAYADTLGNGLGAAALAAMFLAGAALPLGDATKERRAKLRSLVNRSLALVFLVNIMLIPALGAIPNLRFYLALDVALLAVAIASSLVQLPAAVKSGVGAMVLEVAGSILIVLAAALQMLASDMLPAQLRESPWAVSLAAIAVGTALLLLSRKTRKPDSDAK
ncbi:MAG: hypothetical protein JTT11_05570 [Candidatus Brockarchaeota archaeon]|nr:hypothetical protein [Candidatus Brockarchaeota archaeon]